MRIRYSRAAAAAGGKRRRAKAFSWRFGAAALFWLALAFFPTSAIAQTYTAVTGTITDPNGLPYSNAQITFQLTPHQGQATYTPCPSSPCNVQTPGSVQANAAGAFSTQLIPNASILPSGTQWIVGVVEPGVNPPWGTGPQQFSLTVTISGSSQSLSTALSAIAPALTLASTIVPVTPSSGTFNVLSFGAQNNGRTCNVDATSGSPTLTPDGSNPCTFLSGDPGRLAWVMNPATNALICGTATATQTILFQTGGTSATLSGNCNATLTDGTALAYIGSDSLPGWQGACTAMIAANGGLIFAPTGIYMWGIDANVEGACRVPTNYAGGAVGFVGTTQDGTLIYPAPWYTHPSTGAYFFNFAQRTTATILRSFTMDGYFYAKGSGLLGQLIAADFPQANAVTLRNFNLHQVAEIETGTSPGVNIPTYVKNSILCAAPLEGGTGSLVFNQESYQESEVSNNELCTAGYSVGAVDMNAGTLNLTGNRIMATGLDNYGVSTESSLVGAVNLNVFGTVICSNGISGFTAINQGSNSGSNPAIFNIQNVQIDGDRCPNAAGTDVSDFANTSFGSITVLNNQLNANGTGVVFNNAGKIFDQGGNVAAGGAGVLSGAGILFGSASITGTAQTATNITPSTGWGTSGAAGNGVSSVSGDSHAEYFTITAAGTPGANPTIAIVFPTSFWQAPRCQAAEIASSGTNGFSDTIQSTLPTTTGLTLTWEGTPVAASTYTFAVTCQ